MINIQGKRLDEYISDYVVFDLETTGVSTRNDKIIEISALKVRDHKVIDEFSTLVNPERPIPAQASQVNNIFDDMVADAPTISEVFPEFLKFVGGDILLGQNIQRFDLAFIYRECRNNGFEEIKNDYVDTLPIARSCLPELSHHSLSDLAAHFGISTDGAHRALNDCHMTQQVYEKMGPMIEAIMSKAPKCPNCGQQLVKRNGKYGLFWGCRGFPNCRYTEDYTMSGES